MKTHGKTIAICVLLAISAQANPPRDGVDGSAASDSALARKQAAAFSAVINQPNPRMAAQRAQDRDALRTRDQRVRSGRAAEVTQEMTASVTDRVLVVLVEFAGTNRFTWTPGVSTWDPFGQCNPAEYNGYSVGDSVASVFMATNHNVSTPTNFTYIGPLHNEIARPWSAEDASGSMIWTPDFNTAYYANIVSGDGVVFSFTRTNGSAVYSDYTGKSVRGYFDDMSAGRHLVQGDVVGWVRVTNSVWWYGADLCPGARSGAQPAYALSGGIPGAGTPQSLVLDALRAVKAANPAFPWAQYDQNGDGEIDHLWIIHAGLGEDDSTNLLNRTAYGEGGLWSQAGIIAGTNEIVPGVRVGPFLMAPENCGISVLAHEYAHNLGAADLLAYGGGVASPGFWTLMGDNWNGFPTGFLPPSLDPRNLDDWGWLAPQVLSIPTVTTVVVGQASAFPGGANVQRGVRLLLPDQQIPRIVKPCGLYEWWGGKENLANAMMTLKSPVAIPTNGAALTFDLAYDIEEEWDFLWVQVSANGGSAWTTLTNNHTISTHVDGWIGGLYGFTGDLAAAGIGGFTGYNLTFPAFEQQAFNLARFAGSNLLVRFWYMTDWGTVYEGPYMDNVAIISAGATNFFDNAEQGDTNWTYATPWACVGATNFVPHAYYLQWRNVNAGGGYDIGLGDARWEFGPANGGLLVWYDNSKYADNEVMNYMFDTPGAGPKGTLLLVDAHPDPYRDPYWVAYGYTNEGANVTSRSQMRDAAFSLRNAVPFIMTPGNVYTNTAFAGRPAVGTFSDALGYYPGTEFVSRGPGYVPSSYKWVTTQCDSSVVIPAKVFYGIKAPGYTRNQEFRYRAQRVMPAGLLGCYYLGANTGLGYDGGSGNPVDVAGQYGWNVRILSQSDSMATLLISATTLAPPVNVAPADGATGVAQLATLMSTNFTDSSPAATHAASQWQISTTTAFTTIIWDSGEDTLHLASVTVPAGTLGVLNEYCWRVRYKDSFGAWSAFSAPTRFTTADNPRYAAINGAAIWPYDSWCSAASNIQDAIDAAVLGASVFVSNGVYPLAAQLMLTNGNTVRGVAGAGVTMLLCTGAVGRGALVAHPRAVLDGFTVTNGTMAGPGGGVYLATGTVRNCVIIGNKAVAAAGGGVYVLNATLEACTISGNAAGTLGGGVYAMRSAIAGCTVSGNTAGDSGGGMAALTSVVSTCTIRDNLCMNRGGGVYATAVVMRTCLVSGNLAGQDAGGVYLAGNCSVECCTLAGNQAGTGIHGGLAAEPNARNSLVLNSILRLNQPLNADAGENIAYAFSCVTPEVSGTAMITNDPLFVAAGAGNYRLLVGSPCIDAGTNQPWMAAATDLDGNPRICNDQVDMGCYELVPEPAAAALAVMAWCVCVMRRRTGCPLH
ncbi:MAG: immune inhibitor A [bacterium]|nr:immune inhibitor A [bacterium]